MNESNKLSLSSTNVSHAQFLPSLLHRRRIHSLSITHKPQPSTVLLRLPYPLSTISSQINHLYHLLPTKTNKMSRSLQPLPKCKKHKKNKNPRALDHLPTLTLTCKVIKLFNSNNLIQTFSLLSFLSILSFSIPFSFFPFTLCRYIPKEVITKQPQLAYSRGLRMNCRV